MGKCICDLSTAKIHDFLLTLQSAGLTADQAELVIGNHSLAKKWVAMLYDAQPSDRFAHYRSYLKPLHQQASRLKELNDKMPKAMRVSESWFDNLKTRSDHYQSIESLKFFFVVKSTLPETLAYNLKLIELIGLKVHDSRFATNAACLRLDKNAIKYAPGIHLVEINLIDSWLKESAQSVEQARKKASASGKKLAGFESIGAYALQDPKLLMLQDGKHLPYCSLAGLRQGNNLDQAPCFRWDASDRNLDIFTWPFDRVDQYYSVPSVRV